MAKLTPMVEQYLAIKNEYRECLLFFRLGDFYEMFFEDAVTASRELEIVLTSRESGPDAIPMCGVPFHSVSGYLAKLLNKGYKVAICEQMEDPRAAKGIVKREVIRVLTPGTVIEDQLLDEKSNNYLAAVSCFGNFRGLAHIDISTGEFRTTQFGKEQLVLIANELNRIKPAELYILETEYTQLLPYINIKIGALTFGKTEYFEFERATRALLEHFQLLNLISLGCADLPAATISAGAALQYLRETQKNTLFHLRNLTTYETGEFMTLDAAARRNLELTQTIRNNDVNGSLLGILDLTQTAMGGRMLRAWVEQPLVRTEPISQRQAAVGELTLNLEARSFLRDSLRKTYDLQRILSKLSGNSANARDLLALKKTLAVVPEIKAALDPFTSLKLDALRDAIAALPDLTELLDKALVDDPPLTIKEGGMIRGEYDPELYKLLTAGLQGKKWVAELERTERERTGIKSLKVGYNQVFGYYIEVTKSNLNLIPPDYIRKQTLANGERFINQTLKEFEDQILNAREKSIALEYQIYQDIRAKVLEQIDALQKTAVAMAELDALLSLAEVATRYNYVRPELNTDGLIQIIDGRHPVVERMLSQGKFVPNDTMLDSLENRTQIITGPNMAGKSTYMRQVALIVLLAHIGGFVPAKTAKIALVDRIFTRVGASDDLATGQSTFMVEMNEVAYILNHATSQSFIILDEIGRGTSTFDGLSIAWAVIEFVNNLKRIGAKTLVATHYHELTELEKKLDGVKNYHVAVTRDGAEINFLRKILPGSALRSYGIEVAGLAGLPGEITDRAREILNTLEKNEIIEFKEIKKAMAQTKQLSLFPLAQNDVLEQLRSLDLDSMTPLEALNRIYNWQLKLRDEIS